MFIAEVGSLFEFACLEFGELGLGGVRSFPEGFNECRLFGDGGFEGMELVSGFDVGLAFCFELGFEVCDPRLLVLDGSFEVTEAGFEGGEVRHC